MASRKLTPHRGSVGDLVADPRRRHRCRSRSNRSVSEPTCGAHFTCTGVCYSLRHLFKQRPGASQRRTAVAAKCAYGRRRPNAREKACAVLSRQASVGRQRPRVAEGAATQIIAANAFLASSRGIRIFYICRGAAAAAKFFSTN